MAITQNDLTLSGRRWGTNGYSADASGNEELKAAPTGGQSLYLTLLVISTVTAITVTINSDTTAVIGPISFAAGSGSPVVIRLSDEEAIKLTAETALKVDASGAGAVQVLALGFTR